MKSLYSFIAALGTLALFSVSAEARQLTPNEALSRVSTGKDMQAKRLAARAEKTPLFSVSPSGNPDFKSIYVFADEQEGYMIVSADDVAQPLLGYSETGKIDKDNVAPGLNYWLEYYAAEIQQAASQSGLNKINLKASAARPERAPIEPLTVSKWNQSAPYNDDCPMDGSERSVTGCVATAMAQAMYYHKWPQQGQGSHSYTWNNTTLSVDFANKTYDWDNMTPTYDSQSTEAQKEAVANLMYSCGVSVDMDYSSDESGASSLDMGPALYKYFNYDKSMSSPQRYFYGLIDWENMVYSQLEQGLPVLYGGQSYEGGHQFICDGYSSDGYFHFNWGWGGMSDGYFLLSALDPMDQGIGGSASQSGFDFDQGILLNMMPPKEGSKVAVLIYCYGDLETTASQVNLGSTLPIRSSQGFFNFACTEIDGYLGAKLTDTEGNVTYIKNSSLHSFGATSGYEGYDITLSASLSDGTYTLTPVFMEKNSTEWEDILCPLSGTGQLILTVSDGVASVTASSAANLTVTNFTLNTPIYLDEAFSSTVTFTNEGTAEYYGEYNFYLFNEDGEEVASSEDLGAIDLQPGETKTVDYITKFASEYSTDQGDVTVSPGEYYLVMFSHFTNAQIYVYDNFVNVQSAPENTTLRVSNFTVNDGNTNVTDTSDVKFTGTVECTEGYFADQLSVAVFKSGSSSTSLIGKSQFLYLSEGDTADFTADVDLSASGEIEKNYFAIVYQNSGKEISNPLYFSVSTDGIKKLDIDAIRITVSPENIMVTADEGVENVTIFDLNGIEVANLKAAGETEFEFSTDMLGNGSYIITATSTSGAVSASHFIK